ncbi:MAG: hypothetical protein ACRCSM_07160 [Sediminibacterium sp.]|jgi:hypothetical protein|nr:hypothetical protein [Chitinophagaceae bacterium]MCA6447676.1 hypothetical protein [Chitinophagaceae bacterium]
MKNIFNAYRLYTIDARNSNFLALQCKYGEYSPLDDKKFRVTSFQATYCQPIFMHHSSEYEQRILSPFNCETIGLCTLPGNKDSIIVVKNFFRKQIELFISKNEKNNSLILFEMFLEGKLWEDINVLRYTAYSQS